jgi:iron complex outermembrane receptor protein
MKDIINILHNRNYSCVVKNYDEIFTFSQRGVADLFDMVKNKPCFLRDASIADKVVGKGAAALMILGGIKKLYADVISLSALVLLREAGVETDFGRVVPFIWNRDKTDWCPVERMCYEETSVRNIYKLIEEFLSKMNKPDSVKVLDF